MQAGASVGAGATRLWIALGETEDVRRAAAGIVLLTFLRFALGIWLPLSFDEAYYWLWSNHLAAGYFDHPPAIAYIIRLGTSVFGDTPIGVRLVPLILSVLASWSVWRAAEIIFGNARSAALACLYFNLTLMVAAESMAATPDAPALAASALVVLALAQLQASGDGRWWLAVGAAGGLCLLSKYTGLFLAAGVGLWLIATVSGRRWIVTLWPYAGALVAVALFAPVILWNAAHDWISFRFQFGRTAAGGLTARYFGEFLVGQAALASPFILALGIAGFARASRVGSGGRPVAIAAALLWPAILYFLIHATHDRVQGNWPSFLYPAFAVLAAYATDEKWRGRIMGPSMVWVRRLAAPVAAAILLAVYAQAFFDVARTRDPIARLTAFGIEPVMSGIGTIAKQEHARAIVSTSYATTSWLDFYLRPKIPVVHLDEDFRWLSAAKADPALTSRPLLYVTTQAERTLPEIEGHFAHIRHIATLDRRRNAIFVERYDVYAVSGWRGGALGRVP